MQIQARFCGTLGLICFLQPEASDHQIGMGSHSWIISSAVSGAGEKV